MKVQSSLGQRVSEYRIFFFICQAYQSIRHDFTPWSFYILDLCRCQIELARLKITFSDTGVLPDESVKHLGHSLSYRYWSTSLSDCPDKGFSKRVNIQRVRKLFARIQQILQKVRLTVAYFWNMTFWKCTFSRFPRRCQIQCWQWIGHRLLCSSCLNFSTPLICLFFRQDQITCAHTWRMNSI